MLRMKVNNICVAACDAMHGVSEAFDSDRLRALDSRSIGILVVSVLCLVVPLEISHLLSAIVGIVAYLLLQPLNVQRTSSPPDKVRKLPSGSYSHDPRPWSQTRQHHTSPMVKRNPREVPKQVVQKQDVKQPSVMPVVAPTFQNVGWDAEVNELLGLISPTPKGDATIVELARIVKRVIGPIFPGAEVIGFANGNFMSGGTAFGVAVPEVEIVINVSPTALSERLQGHRHAANLNMLKLQKSAIRACTDRLVSTGNFKFRRSAFRGQEPKVTIIAPAVSENCEQGIPMNLSVNASTPLYNAILLSECKQMEPCAQELILFVKRWAKDRGLCHTARGHFSPYAWTLLSIFFLQAGNEERPPMLPSLACFARASELMVKGDTKEVPTQATLQTSATKTCLNKSKPTAGALFKEFVHFYANEFNWHKEAVSVRLGKRAPPDLQLPLHIIIDEENGTTEVGPSIEDPFEKANNLGACMTMMSLKHLQAEFKRADNFCTNGASLTTLLEPWAPGDVHSAVVHEEEEGEQL